jgi:hypothetical protein
MSKQLNLTHFFSSNKRVRPSSSPIMQQEQTQSSPTPVLIPDETHTMTTMEINDSTITKKHKSNEQENLTDTAIQATSKNDIGLFVNKDHVSTLEIYGALAEPWTPSGEYNFPKIKVHQKMRSVCQHSWLSTYPWLSYSLILRGVLCRYCVLFKRKWSQTDRAKNPLGQLVLKPLTSLHKAHDYFQLHEKTDYHLFSKEQAEKFTLNYLNPNNAIDHILDSECQQQEATNRKILSSIIKCILFIGKQNLALRGHDDDGIDHHSMDNLGNIILTSNRCTF